MKFKCPRPETWSEMKERKGKWRRKLCLVPHRMPGEHCIWLGYIEQRAEWDHWRGSWTYYYREIKKCKN